MPTTTISENNEQNQSILKNNDNQIKSDVGANIVLIGAPGSGKYLFFFLENLMFIFLQAKVHKVLD